ncbi:MAG: fatty acid CoA ligase family protein, partial [Phycisphaerae bacterium]
MVSGIQKLEDAVLNRPQASVNVATHLRRMADRYPQRPAVVVALPTPHSRPSRYRQVTFAELETLTNRYANGLTEIGIARGTRTLVMVKPGIEFTGLIFAMFKMAAVPVLIDPGMGAKRLLQCIRQIQPQAMIGTPLAHALRTLRPQAFRSVRRAVTVGRRWFWGGPTLDRIQQSAGDCFNPVNTQAHDEAAVLFTSGATGVAKGVRYHHGMFVNQVRMIQSLYDIQPGEVDLSCFPLFALFCAALGTTSVIPDMDASRPGAADPKKIIRAINDQATTSSFGSPALWERVARHCLRDNLRLTSLRRVLIAGAPVSPQLLDRLGRVLDASAEVHTPYGATEALPIASISAAQVLGTTGAQSAQGAGTCVGKPAPDTQVRIIRIVDQAIAQWSDDLPLPPGPIGEIVVAGPVVTRQYVGLPEATCLAQIPEGDTVWHRVGDVGYLDDRGLLWYCGRKSHRVTTDTGVLFTVPCEAIFNEHPDVFRSALIGLGPPEHQRPVIIIQPEAGRLTRA